MHEIKHALTGNILFPYNGKNNVIAIFLFIFDEWYEAEIQIQLHQNGSQKCRILMRHVCDASHAIFLNHAIRNHDYFIESLC